jgi:hypothetical protein
LIEWLVDGVATGPGPASHPSDLGFSTDRELATWFIAFPKIAKEISDSLLFWQQR